MNRRFGIGDRQRAQFDPDVEPRAAAWMGVDIEAAVHGIQPLAHAGEAKTIGDAGLIEPDAVVDHLEQQAPRLRAQLY